MPKVPETTPSERVIKAVVVVGTMQSAFPPLNNPCLSTTSPFAAMPWCNHTLPIDLRIKDMLGRMTIAEKIAALDTATPAIKSLGLAAYNWWSEATHGVSHTNSTGDTPAATNFAFPITTAASFNRTLWHATGAAISREARAFMNAGHAYSTYWAPVINLASHVGAATSNPPARIRLSGECSISFVHGFKQLPEESRYLAASACCKHYVANIWRTPIMRASIIHAILPIPTSPHRISSTLTCCPSNTV